MVGHNNNSRTGTTLKYDVTFTMRIQDPSVSVLDLVELQGNTSFPLVIVVDGDEVSVTCRGVESQGLMALPEALRKGQVQLSHALRDHVPAFSGRGLLWSDIVAADVRAVG